ncbi:MAG: hypothetical protein K0B06_12410, partial [Brevefilum sp.]|nr:hypothetical protein [Brevefilum sp.]
SVGVHPTRSVLRKRKGFKVPSFQGRDLGIGRENNFMIILLLVCEISLKSKNYSHLLAKIEGFWLDVIMLRKFLDFAIVLP